MNKILIVLFLFLGFVSCKPKQMAMEELDSEASAEEELTETVIETLPEVSGIQMTNTLESFEIKLLDALHKQDFTQLAKFMPTVAVAKGVSPKETDSKSDKEIAEELMNPLIGRMREKFSTMTNHLIDNGINLKETGVKSRSTEEMIPGETTMMVYSLDVGDNKKYAQMAFMYMEWNDEIYLFDIIMSKPVIKEI